jgi:hypothetical protein
MEDDLTKTINQLDSVDSSVNEVMDVMSVIYKEVVDKLSKDKICFVCKSKAEFKDLMLVLANNSPNGAVSICSVCSNCFKKIKGEKNGGK